MCSQRLLLGGALGLAACAGRVEDVRGVESYVGKIELDGVNRFTKKEFLAYLTIDERSLLIWRPKVPFEEATLVTDAARIRASSELGGVTGRRIGGALDALMKVVGL